MGQGDGFRINKKKAIPTVCRDGFNTTAQNERRPQSNSLLLISRLFALHFVGLLGALLCLFGHLAHFAHLLALHF